MEREQAGRIFVVDDDSAIRELIVQILREAGWEVEEAENGLLALERLGSHSFDLIFTDNMMPGLNGIDMIRRLREKGDRTPAILITGQAMDPGVIRGADEVGVDIILGKPVTIEKIMGAVRRFLPTPSQA